MMANIRHHLLFRYFLEKKWLFSYKKRTFSVLIILIIRVIILRYFEILEGFLWNYYIQVKQKMCLN